ncbi:hypothetical protein DFH65_004560 [Clostridium beijerinckii]|nr:hypothetical protein [Clostridium beijerinckii]
MWILKKVLAMVLLINITVKFTEISTFYSLNLNNKNTANIAVLLYTFDPFMSSLKQSLETIQRIILIKSNLLFLMEKTI